VTPYRPQIEALEDRNLLAPAAHLPRPHFNHAKTAQPAAPLPALNQSLLNQAKSYLGQGPVGGGLCGDLVNQILRDLEKQQGISIGYLDNPVRVVTPRTNLKGAVLPGDIVTFDQGTQFVTKSKGGTTDITAPDPNGHIGIVAEVRDGGKTIVLLDQNSVNTNGGSRPNPGEWTLHFNNMTQGSVTIYQPYQKQAIIIQGTTIIQVGP
jgi:hypothetical protein